MALALLLYIMIQCCFSVQTEAYKLEGINREKEGCHTHQTNHSVCLEAAMLKAWTQLNK